MHQSSLPPEEVPAAIINPGDFVVGLGVVTNIRWNANGVWLYSGTRGEHFGETETCLRAQNTDQ